MGIFEWGLRRLREEGEKHIAHDGILTYQVIGRYDNTAKKHDGRGDSVMRPEDHIVDHGLVDQVSHLDEAGDRRHQAEHCHFRSICKREEERHRYLHRFSDDRLLPRYTAVVSQSFQEIAFQNLSVI